MSRFCIALWFVLWGANALFSLNFSGFNIILGVLAFLAGILLFLGK